jgi:hypothetical protein
MLKNTLQEVVRHHRNIYEANKAKGLLDDLEMDYEEEFVGHENQLKVRSFSKGAHFILLNCNNIQINTIQVSKILISSQQSESKNSTCCRNPKLGYGILNQIVTLGSFSTSII